MNFKKDFGDVGLKAKHIPDMICCFSKIEKVATSSALIVLTVSFSAYHTYRNIINKYTGATFTFSGLEKAWYAKNWSPWLHTCWRKVSSFRTMVNIPNSFTKHQEPQMFCSHCMYCLKCSVRAVLFLLGRKNKCSLASHHTYSCYQSVSLFFHNLNSML